MSNGVLIRFVIWTVYAACLARAYKIGTPLSQTRRQVCAFIGLMFLWFALDLGETSKLFVYMDLPLGGGVNLAYALFCIRRTSRYIKVLCSMPECKAIVRDVEISLNEAPSGDHAEKCRRCTFNEVLAEHRRIRDSVSLDPREPSRDL